MRSNRWRALMAGAWTLGLLLVAGCGPGVGGTGTGNAAFTAFDVHAVSVCDSALAAELGCAPPPAGMGPVGTGAPPVRFADAAGQVVLELSGNLASLDAQCQRLHFSGEFGAGAGGVEAFFGSYDVEGAGMSGLAALSAVPVAGGGALTVELRDAGGRLVVGPVLLQRAPAVLPAPNPC